MIIFGVNVPLWVILSIIFGSVYVLFSVLSAIRVKRIKTKRNDKNVTNNI